MYTHWPKSTDKGGLDMKLSHFGKFRSCVYAAAYGSSKKRLKKMAREANPRMPAREIARRIKSIYEYLEY